MYSCRTSEPRGNTYFVFGSNLAGRHGSGAAKTALEEWGAHYGKGVGFQGKSYGIPTKDGALRILPLDTIKTFVDEFILNAKANPRLSFRVTAIGTGLAGYKHKDIAPMFKDAPTNCTFDVRWKEFLGDGYDYFDFEAENAKKIIERNLGPSVKLNDFLKDFGWKD